MMSKRNVSNIFCKAIALLSLLILTSCNLLFDPFADTTFYPQTQQLVAVYSHESYDIDVGYDQIEVVDNWLFATSNSILFWLDISNPEVIRLKATYKGNWDQSNSMAISGNVLVVGDENTGATLFDISSPYNFEPIGEINLNPNKLLNILTVSADTLLLSEVTETDEHVWTIINISDVNNIALVKTIEAPGVATAIYNSAVYTYHDVDDIGNKTKLYAVDIEIDSELSSYEEGRISDVAVYEDYLLISYGGGVSVYALEADGGRGELVSPSTQTGGGYSTLATAPGYIIGDGHTLKVEFTNDSQLSISPHSKNRGGSSCGDVIKQAMPSGECPIRSYLLLDKAVKMPYVYRATEEAGILIVKIP